MTRRLTIILAAGGTGGHVFPALAAAEALRARGCRVIVATDGRGKRFEGDFETATIKAGALSGGLLRKTADAVRIGAGVLQAVQLILASRADAVVGFGGYPSLPTMLAAWLLRRPTALHEQNAVLGRVNRLLAHRVDRVATAFPNAKGAPAGRTILVGNPVRAAIAAIAATPYTPPASNSDIHLLIVGGSQGARVMSDVLPGAVALLPAEIRHRLRLVQQCRPEDMERVAAAYRAALQPAELKCFFDDMPARLAAAHLIVARAGASTVAELAAAGRPAILIPFGAAMDDHQTMNAQALVDVGAAWRLAERDATVDAVATALTEALANSPGLTAAAKAARDAGRPNAAEALADLIEDIAGARGRPAGAHVAGGIAA